MEIKGDVIYTDIDNKDVLAWKFMLDYLTFEKISKEIESYQFTCLNHSTSFSRIEDKINSLFNVEYLGQNIYPNFYHSIISENGDRIPNFFFRIRKMNKDVYYDIDNENNIITSTLDFEDIQSLNDVWEKPAKKVDNYQRLSRPQNSVLYTSLMTSTALLETEVNENDSLFYLIVYKSKKKINYSDCTKFVYYNNLSETDNLKRYIIFQFLRNEFTRIFPKSYNSENQYCAAVAISEKFFIASGVEGIQYPSTRGLGDSNFAFWSSSARECLEFIALRYCKMINKQENESNHAVFADCFWNDEINKFEYFSQNSKKSKQTFDEPLLNFKMSK